MPASYHSSRPLSWFNPTEGKTGKTIFSLSPRLLGERSVMVACMYAYLVFRLVKAYVFAFVDIRA